MAKYTIQYPSGKRFEASGEFQLVPLDDWLMPVVMLPDECVLALDQRAIVTHGGVEVYSPRRNLDGLQPEMAEWLVANQEWANG